MSSSEEENQDFDSGVSGSGGGGGKKTIELEAIIMKLNCGTLINHSDERDSRRGFV
jgi:hypothetical protein